MSRIALAVALAWSLSTPAVAMTRARSSGAADHYRDGKLRYAAKDYTAALREFEEAYRLDPAPTMLINIGQCLRALGRDNDAIAAYRKFLDVGTGQARLRDEVFEALDGLRLKHLPRNPAPARDAAGAEHYYRGRLAYAAGDYDRALVEFHAAYVKAPAPGMLVNIGNALRKLDRPGEAIAAYRTFLDTPSGSKRLRLEVFEAEEAVRKDLDRRMYQLAESAAQFQRYLDSKQGSVEVRVVMQGTVKQMLDMLVRLDEQSNARYVVDKGSNAVALRRVPRAPN